MIKLSQTGRVAAFIVISFYKNINIASTKFEVCHKLDQLKVVLPGGRNIDSYSVMTFNHKIRVILYSV